MTQLPLIVTTDLSVRSDRAVERGLRLAAQLDARARVLHVVSRSGAGPRAKAQAERLFHDDFGPVPDCAEFVVEFGDPAAVIASAARQGAMIVVTGVSQLNEALDFVLGTTVERLVRECPAPVLAVKRRSSEFYRRVLIACDFSDCSREAVQAAATLFPEAEFCLVHVYHAPYRGFLDRESTIGFVRTEAEERSRAFLSEIEEPVRSRLAVRLEEGDSIPEAITVAARHWRADLVVAGSHGRSGLAHALIGSRAVEIIDCVPFDTLVFRRSVQASPAKPAPA